jgi:Flp pilus assembly pilin Flp
MDSREEDRDMVEYALVVALIAIGDTSRMKVLATGRVMLPTASARLSAAS